MRHLQCISAARSQDHCMYQGSSSAACLGGNITSPLGWTSWSTVAVVVRVWVAGGVVADWEFPVDVEASFKVAELFMETVCLYLVFNAQQGLVFSLKFSHNGPSVDFQLCMSLVVVAVLFDLGIYGGVFK